MAEPNTWRQAIASELNKLDSPLKVSTVIAYVEQQLAAQPYDTDDFWGRPDTCARSTWNKWKKWDTAFTAVLEATWQIAKSYRTDEAAAAIEEAVHRLQMNAPNMAGTLIDMGSRKPGYYKDDAITLRAAIAALDRASKLTAEKGPETPINIPSLDEAIERIFGSQQATPGEGETAVD